MYPEFLKTHLLQWMPAVISSKTSAVHAVYKSYLHAIMSRNEASYPTLDLFLTRLFKRKEVYSGHILK